MCRQNTQQPDDDELELMRLDDDGAPQPEVEFEDRSWLRDGPYEGYDVFDAGEEDILRFWEGQEKEW